ncbi:MAG: hypothetical protein R3C53_07535 [Pirellulaceae bacterium]
MSKFYVSCGTHTLVVAAESAQQAAMRLIDELLAAHAWIYEDETLDEQTRREHLVFEALLHLASEVHVSERGLGRTDAGQFGVPELLDEWHQLMTAVSKLFAAAGIDPDRGLPNELAELFAPYLPR